MDYTEKLNRIIKILKSGERSKSEFKVGGEFEHIIINNKSMESINYYQESGIKETLEKMIKLGYKPKYEEGNLLGLENENSAITLEPGGQLEVSLKPCITINEMEALYLKFLQDIIPIMEEQNQTLMAIGYHPKTCINEIPFNPKKRYKYMSDHFKKMGGIYAHNMMKGTASLQVVIDYSSEVDFVKKYKVAHFISPLLAMISDNAPIFEGELYLQNSIRSTIWDNTDSIRGGLVEGVMEKHFGYEDYAKYILQIPPIFIQKGGKLIETGELTANEVMDIYSLSDEEVEHILSMVFPDIRARRYIEIRVGDSIPYPYNLGYIALIKGIFYNDDPLNYLYQLSEATNDHTLKKYKKSMIENGFNGCFRGKKIYEFLPLLLDLAKVGLSQEEKQYIIRLEELIRNKNNLAIILKEAIRNNTVNFIEICGLNHKLGRI